MQFCPTGIPRLFTVELEPVVDERGFFARAWCRNELLAHGLTSECQQANLTYNVHQGTLRGMHYQRSPHGDAKLLRVIRGAIHDVVLDLRRQSETFGRWFACELSAENRRAIFIPEGCAHGYLTLTEHTELFYLHSAIYQPHAAAGIHWNCSLLHDAWPFAPTVVSERDQQWPSELELL